MTILRLLELESGAISIDGVDLSTVPRELVRTRIITLPQDPVKLSGTVRQNLIPGETAASLTTAGGNEDERLESALTRVGMWDLIRERGRLDADFGDIELSQGQRQLFCLARAILRRNDSTIVFLDEPTSSIDRETDERVMRVIREDFKRCTVIAVAHRLETILDSDVIAVMDAGKIQEVGEPEALLGQDESRFKALWDSRNGRM